MCLTETIRCSLSLLSTLLQLAKDDFVPLKYITIAGVNCTVWSSTDGTQQQGLFEQTLIADVNINVITSSSGSNTSSHMSIFLVATTDAVPPVLVQVISRDSNLNIVEFVRK